MRLTATNIRALALPEDKHDVIHFDSGLPKFGIRLRRASGGRVVRSWVCQFRVRGRSQRVLLGSADILNPEQARTAAKTLLAKVALGHDPQAEKAAKRQQAARTFRSVVEAYLAAKQPGLRPVSLRIARLYLLTGSYFRSLHPFAVNVITRSDIATCVRAISRKHSVTTAAAARRALSAFFAWSIAEGVMGDCPNPVDGSYRPADPTPRDHVLADAELVAIWNACGDDDYGRIVRLLILLGNRRQEIGSMKFSELNMGAGTWTLPAERSKNRRSHTITLPAPALTIINSVPRLAGRDPLFGDRANGFTGWGKGKAELDARLGNAVAPWQVRDLRRACASGMQRLGVRVEVIERALNHVSGSYRGVAGVYQRDPMTDEVRTAFVRWSEHVLALVEGRPDKVIALRA
jgi:integrase